MPVRYRVVGFLLGLASLTYLDRVCISKLAPDIMREFGLSAMQMSWVFSSFTIAYAAFEIPTAWWADRIGSRRVLTRIVAWWSAFTIVTAAAWNLPSLLTIRFLFGIGEAGAWPNAARVFSRWIPSTERGKVQGIFFAAAHFSGGVTPLLVVALHKWLAWRAIFILFGCIGFIWVVGWWIWFRDEPREHPSVTPAERDLIESRRGTLSSHGASPEFWSAVWRAPRIWALCAMYFANTYGFYFLITWFPTYVTHVPGLPDSQQALFAGLPLMMSVIADLTGGMTTDYLAARFGLRWGRQLVGGGGYLLGAIAVLLSTVIAQPQLSVSLIAVGAAFSMFTLAPSWASCIEMGGTASGTLAAIMNTFGQFGGIISPLLVAHLVDTYGNWTLPIYVLGGLYAMASVCWLAIDPTRPLVREHEPVESLR